LPLREKSNGTSVSKSGTGGRVAVVSTGGTIASLHSDDEKGVQAALPIEELLQRAGESPSEQIGPVVELARVNSWNVDPALMWQVASTVDGLAAEEDVAGIVVTHGTDTLEETAFLVDVLVDSEKPVVFTASMRSADELSADGPQNLRSALRAAGSRALRGLGTLVCLDGQIQPARWARKSHTYSTGAFSADLRPLATVDPDGRVRRMLGDLRRWTAPVAIAAGEPRPDDVPVLQAYTGMSARAAQSLLEATSPRGVVVEGFGLGHVPVSLLSPIRDLVAKGVVVVVSTRVPNGGTWSIYGGPGGGTDLAAMGVVGAGNLSAGKARLLLLACLAGQDSSTAQKLFQEAVAVLGLGAEE
jgi:L-asparaginase